MLDGAPFLFTINGFGPVADSNGDACRLDLEGGEHSTSGIVLELVFNYMEKASGHVSKAY